MHDEEKSKNAFKLKLMFSGGERKRFNAFVVSCAQLVGVAVEIDPFDY